MQLVIVRHGRTEANARGLLLGRLDVALDELGRAQAERLAASTGPVDRVVASPLQRTRQTAAAFDQPVEIDERLIELDYGEYDGRPFADVPAGPGRGGGPTSLRPARGRVAPRPRLRVRQFLDELTAHPTRRDRRGRLARLAHQGRGGVGPRRGRRGDVATVRRAGVDHAGRGDGAGSCCASFNEAAHLSGL